ncbi:histidinol-phosphate transaminase [Rickettsiella endosymbiont of Miltochrista miniata]|uniref:histidinol-phosphate transaminase n=1 Tax=Rickettsiella endosymbiont of Miltochrista miniata TaxID=3066239 RepID=UPI00313F3426
MTISSKKNSGFNAEKPAEIIKLDLNENPLGASPLAITAGQQAMLNCHRYPDNDGFSLKKSLSAHLSILPENITLGNGSESLLELIVKNTLGPLNSAVIPNFCFTGISKILKKANIAVKIAKNSHSYLSAVSLLEAIEPMTTVVFIVNPNNPTGNYMNKLELLYLLRHLPQKIFVVLDEAYAEYVETDDYPDSTQLLKQFPNLIILRTFSKIYGLAGLRLGYAISELEIASSLNLSSLPFRVNAVALAAAEASLKDQKHVNAARLINRLGYFQLSKGLQNLGLKVLPSYTNFICLDLKSPSWPIYQELLLYGISVRPLHDYSLSRFLRVSIGTDKQNQSFLNTLEKILIKSSI